ncbi:DsbA family oxidoreductase [Thalassospira sp. TSL5-1]|uniref:DsbA family oxidoreductase n=1 Tax=Thalassospira sp. TSL5-1 TaxID=1544451 RepID=UPI000939F197|nr:DsbA family oxidoreductase [Thalassospira sp. TSL5-1]OKH88971.1 DSBA oxidoreductase [Thalassospira sp. TSL5-1]
MSHPTKMQIDIVSDVVCPWCIIGYKHLEQALANLDGQIDAKLRWHPFELNPDMGPDGQDLKEHIHEKFGLSPDQSAENRARIQTMGENAGFEIRFSSDSRIYNTFDAHRVLYWAGKKGKQTELQLALFAAYFQEAENPGDHGVLKRCCEEVGLSPEEAAEILASDKFASEVRAEEEEFKNAGITSVPTYVVNGKYAISGGHPPEVFEQALSEIARGVEEA